MSRAEFSESEPELDAFMHPQRVRPGCQHQLGCRCTPPYWLRESSPIESARVERWFGVRHAQPKQEEL